MTQAEFKRQLEFYVRHYMDKSLCSDTYDERLANMETVSIIRATISRTIRLCVQHPKLAQEYFDNLPKATMD